MQVAEERMGKQWAVPRMGLFAFAITDTRGGGTTSERDLALAVERSRMQWEAEIKAEVEMVSEWFEPIEGDKELPVNDEGDVHGRARCTFPSGNVYIGDFRNGLKHGKGTWRYKRGNVEVGFFGDGDQIGRGVKLSADRKTAWLTMDREVECEVPVAEARSREQGPGFF